MNRDLSFLIIDAVRGRRLVKNDGHCRLATRVQRQMWLTGSWRALIGP